MEWIDYFWKAILIFLILGAGWLWPAMLIIARIIWPIYNDRWGRYHASWDKLNKIDYIRILTPPLFIFMQFDATDLEDVEINKLQMKADLNKWGTNLVYFLPVICIGFLWLM